MQLTQYVVLGNAKRIAGPTVVVDEFYEYSDKKAKTRFDEDYKDNKELDSMYLMLTKKL